MKGLVNWRQLLLWLFQGFFMTLGYLIASNAVYPWVVKKFF
jgi:hypothetical protein